MINIPQLILKNITDIHIRDNFLRLKEFFQDDVLLKGQWQFFELTFDGAVTDQDRAHGLGFKPLDVIQTSVTGAGTITFNNDSFTNENINVTTTGACVVRCFIGAYREQAARNSR